MKIKTDDHVTAYVALVAESSHFPIAVIRSACRVIRQNPFISN
ncbi:hypothetical protein ACEN9X_04580 [Mucilaginibacter sp. Mucisp86]